MFLGLERLAWLNLCTSWSLFWYRYWWISVVLLTWDDPYRLLSLVISWLLMSRELSFWGYIIWLSVWPVAPTTLLFADMPRDTGRVSNLRYWPEVGLGEFKLILRSCSFFLSFSRSSSLNSTFIVVSLWRAFACALFSMRAKRRFNCSYVTGF